MKKFVPVLILFTAAWMIGCGSQQSSSPAGETAAAPDLPAAQSAPEEAQSSAALQSGQAASPQPKVSKPAREAPQAAPAQRPTSEAPAPPSDQPREQLAESSQPVQKVVRLERGTELVVRLAQAISTRQNQSGERFEAILDEPILVNERTIFPKGTRVTGRLLEVVPSGKVKGRARMQITLERIWTSPEDSHPLEVNTIRIEAEGSQKRDATVVGGGAGVGALIGAIAGGKKGAAIGAAVGGGVGTAVVLTTKGEEVEFEAEQKFSFRLEEDLEIRVD